MKVVGGPWDGRETPVRDGYRYVVLWHPINPERVVDWLCSEVGRNLDPRGPTYGQTMYTVRRFSFGSNDDYFEFLAPHEWSDKQAFLHQFSK